MGSAARPPSSRAVKVEIGRQRVDGDDSRRFTPAAITFDTRAHTLTTEIKDDWEEQIKKQWLTNQSHVKEAIIYQFGIEDFEQKIRDFRLFTLPVGVAVSRVRLCGRTVD